MVLNMERIFMKGEMIYKRDSGSSSILHEGMVILHESVVILHEGMTILHESVVILHEGMAILHESVVILHEGMCHDRDIPPQPSHTCSCPPAVQTPPEHSLTKPEPIPGLPDPSIAFPNSSTAFPKGCCTDVCLVSIPEAVNIIPEHI